MPRRAAEPPVDPVPPHSRESIFETLESIVMAIVLALVFRAFVVEPYVIPTGSMAPTLLGQHVTARCPQCGYRFPVGPRSYRQSDSMIAEPVQTNLRIPCPMCRFAIRYASVPTSAGDRILVLKYNYALSAPRRWDVVVFKDPNAPERNFIKRLAGLSGEQLWIVDGNVYTRPLSFDGTVREAAPWRIQRKADRPEVQRAVWQPVYHTDFYPLDGGELGAGSGREDSWWMPWRGEGLGGTGKWVVERGPRWRWVNTHPGLGVGRLTFDFSGLSRVVSQPTYNLIDRNPGSDENHGNALGEMRLAATVIPQGPNLELSLELAGRWLGVRGRVEPDGRITIAAGTRGEEGEWPIRAEGRSHPLRAGRASVVELWHVDQSVSVWVDGRLVAGPWKYELEEIGETLEDASYAGRFAPGAGLELTGAEATLRSIQLDRDLYYTQAARNPGRATRSGPASIHEGYYFCLGDNSPKSDDGRCWLTVDPWVEESLGPEPGFVPRDLMLGRAFFVYYPSSHRIPNVPLGVPNFGEMRFIR